MTWGEKILQSLAGQKELEKQLTFEFVPQRSRKPYGAACGNNCVTLSLEVEDFDRFGLVLRGMQFELANSSGDEETGSEFEDLVTRLEKVSHLYGELRLIERDDDSQQAVLRTSPDSSNRFFEVVLRGGHTLTLGHFTVHEKTRKRIKTSANMSTESFVLLVDQLFDLVGK